MPSKRPLDEELARELNSMQAEFCKGMSHPKRIPIITTLKSGERTVNEIVGVTGIPQENLSQHLGFMRQQGLLKTRREGMNIYYSIADRRIITACGTVREIVKDRIKRVQGILPA